VERPSASSAPERGKPRRWRGFPHHRVRADGGARSRHRVVLLPLVWAAQESLWGGPCPRPRSSLLEPRPPDAGPRVRDDVQATATVCVHPWRAGMASRSALRPDPVEARHRSVPSGEHHCTSFPIRDRSRTPVPDDHEPQRVHHEVPLSAPDGGFRRRRLVHRHDRDGW